MPVEVEFILLMLYAIFCNDIDTTGSRAILLSSYLLLVIRSILGSGIEDSSLHFIMLIKH